MSDLLASKEAMLFYAIIVIAGGVLLTGYNQQFPNISIWLGYLMIVLGAIFLFNQFFNKR